MWLWHNSPYCEMFFMINNSLMQKWKSGDGICGFTADSGSSTPGPSSLQFVISWALRLLQSIVTCPFLWHIFCHSSVTVKWGSPSLSLSWASHTLSAGAMQEKEAGGTKEDCNESWKVIKKWMDPAARIFAKLPMCPNTVCNLQIDTMLHFSYACLLPLIV